MSIHINVMLQGGLGNQLFQLAWARYVESVSGRTVSYNSKMLLGKGMHGGIRLSDLIDFDHGQSSESCIFFETGFFAKVARLIVRKSHLRKIGSYLLYDYDADTKFETSCSAMNAEFHFGYFQYVQSALYIREELLSLILQKHSVLLDKARDLYSTSVGVHVRRGDFLLSRDPRHKVMGEDYYFKAIKHFKGRRFVVFTDDKQWCEEVFKGQDFEICGLLGTEVKPAIADFLSLICCKDYIIGASTFAWWTAFLSLSDNPVVHMPCTNHLFQSESSNRLLGWNYILSD
ncbi:alpha-1,2-fucosyltransferase [Pseudomonas marginalis]|uniref:alpha-1,2-fucosyltransferase n=1 Tax=Pseudomonas marginalis TaxID=298 RepID=UPI002A3640F8|nr:alpha-1,2-fucosyltransferase [Pseudomonas marginalis]WPN25476.1 alpha-1,2-fucosyltransferase [Pseudomonas marginalis]